ncbi:MAG: prepilin-type N-terminal cleavage/methylation domain-containing protein [Bacilli bacterium]
MKKGFTLVEMLAVITLLGLLAIIVVPATELVIKGSREDSYQVQLENMKQGLKNWGAKHILELPETEGQFIEKTLGDLKKEGLIEVDFRDPRNKKCINNMTVLRITRIKKNYTYEIRGTVTTTETCEVA